MIRTASRDDLPLIRDLFRRANDSPYDLEAVAEEKCFGRGYSGEPTVRIYDDAGVAVRCGKYLRILAVDRDRRGRGIGSALLADAAPHVIAAEPGNYFLPGVLDTDAPFFRKRGFRETAETWNLHADLAALSGSAVNPISPQRLPVTPGLLEFVRREFGPIWAFEIERATAAFWIPETGFAVVEGNNRGLGTFGPTGVAKDKRGLGHGRGLLLAALRELAAMGYARAIIPWTDAIDFYRRGCGAEPAHRFVTLTAC
ncbi:MAG TPA: GNAT family N-acetyltransferase [Thermoanaerobaculia bacterium]|nr:GNAT family N-acetyltransferase [Thermoanaerobaculia bacterium]